MCCPSICTIQKQTELGKAIVATKRHFSESDNPADSKRRCPSHRCHMKNAVLIFSCEMPTLSDLTGRAKGSAAGFGVSSFVCVMVFAYPESFVSFKSQLRRRNFWSTWTHIPVIRKQPCFFVFSRLSLSN